MKSNKTFIVFGMGRSASSLPDQEVIDNFSKYDNKAKQIVNSKDDKPLWGWKDPRTAATLKKYIDHVEDPILICPFRKVEKVGESLHARDGISVEDDIKMAKDYNKRVIKYLEEHYT